MSYDVFITPFDLSPRGFLCAGERSLLFGDPPLRSIASPPTQVPLAIAATRFSLRLSRSAFCQPAFDRGAGKWIQ
jgi:hypothetical protein